MLIRLLREQLPSLHRNLYDHASLRFAPRMRMHLVPGDFISDSIVMTGVYDEELT
jgi:hypothetical protein